MFFSRRENLALSNIKPNYESPVNSLIETDNWNESSFAIAPETSTNKYSLTFNRSEIEQSQIEQSQEINNCQITFNHTKFSPNGKLLVIAGSDQCESDATPFFILWDKSKMNLVRSLNIDNTIVSPRSAFSPDSRFMAISDETKIKLFETVSGKEIKQFIGHSDIILRLQFSLDGKFLLSESQDNTSKNLACFKRKRTSSNGQISKR
ncbi:MAG: hypothetical protein IPJ30_26525 [Acidobacteria bacterium]|nr:hypothetical protein [Acidobacteriota bacterium]